MRLKDAAMPEDGHGDAVNNVTHQSNNTTVVKPNESTGEEGEALKTVLTPTRHCHKFDIKHMSHNNDHKNNICGERRRC